MIMTKSDLSTKVGPADDLAIKSVSDDGRFSGYLSRWNVVDLHRERVAPAAFRESLAALEAKGRKLPVLWQHRAEEPIGVWDVLKEDDHGLYGEGALWLDVAPMARLAHRGMKAGAITGLSIGFRTKGQSFDAARIRTLTALDLHEGSIVTAPALEEARIDTVKMKLAAGERITEREFGKILREKGFSRADADQVAEIGFKAWAAGAGRPSQASNSAASDLVKALSGFSLPSI